MTIETLHRVSIRIYYEDTDFSGAVYHAGYLRFMERARTEFLRDRGVAQAGLVDEAGQPLGFVVRHMAVDFMKPARMDDLVDIETTLSERGAASLVLQQRVVRDADVLVSAAVKVALVGGGRARRFPPGLAASIFGSKAR